MIKLTLKSRRHSKEKILFLTKYTDHGPSSRYRFYQYLPVLNSAGLEYVVKPLFNDKYIKRFYGKGEKSIFGIVQSYLKRFLILFTFHNYRLLVVEYELFPYLPAWFESLSKFFAIRYIVDYDDAIFANYIYSKNIIIRLSLRNKIKKVIENANSVIVGNKYLFDYAIQFNKNVNILPTVVENKRIRKVPSLISNKVFTIGWIGSPSSSKYLLQLVSVFKKLDRDLFNINIIGFDSKLKMAFNNLNINWIQWDEITEASELEKFDVGIMPLSDDPWSKGKCGFKLILYMASSIPVIASPVGINTEIVEHGVNGFLAATPEDWLKYILYLKNNTEIGIEMGRKGFQKYINRFSLDATSKTYLNLLT